MLNNIRFSVGTRIDGFEVVDNDGRPVSPILDFSQAARDLADELNAAALKGRSTLARALGAAEYVA